MNVPIATEREFKIGSLYRPTNGPEYPNRSENWGDAILIDIEEDGVILYWINDYISYHYHFEFTSNFNLIHEATND